MVYILKHLRLLFHDGTIFSKYNHYFNKNTNDFQIWLARSEKMHKSLFFL